MIFPTQIQNHRVYSTLFIVYLYLLPLMLNIPVVNDTYIISHSHYFTLYIQYLRIPALHKQYNYFFKNVFSPSSFCPKGRSLHSCFKVIQKIIVLKSYGILSLVSNNWTHNYVYLFHLLSFWGGILFKKEFLFYNNVNYFNCQV